MARDSTRSPLGGQVRLGVLIRLGVSAMIVTAAGCSALPGPRATGSVPPVDLQLLSAGALSLPADCEPASGTVYRATFLVERDGRVGDVRAESAPACVREALTEWVASFRYAPPGATVPATIDWMAVVAQRGG